MTDISSLKSPEEILFNMANIYNKVLKAVMPAKVESIDLSAGKATCKIMIKKLNPETQEYTDYPLVNDVPVTFPHAQDALLWLPVKAGDDGILLFCDRSLENFLAKTHDNTIAPSKENVHHIEDAIFIPCNLQPFSKQPTIPDDNSAGLKNGQMSIVLHPTGKIEIKGASAEVLAVLSSMMGNLSTAANNFSSFIGNIATFSTACALSVTDPVLKAAAIALNAVIITDFTNSVTDKANIDANKGTLDTMKV